MFVFSLLILQCLAFAVMWLDVEFQVIRDIIEWNSQPLNIYGTAFGLFKF